MHVAAALMLGSILRRLAVPGAYLAAAIFALHPAQAESVAWMTELKNTLSAVFFFGAALLYLRFDQRRTVRWYLGALGAFVLALLTKTVTGTLPGALLVAVWWLRGRLSWKRDVMPLVPFLLLGAGFGLGTASWELEFNNVVGPDFQFTLVERALIAGRVVWFLLAKLFWPADLIFIYPRWQIDAGAWWQYLFPLGVAACVASLWAIRRWSRGPLAAMLLYCGMLFPVMGFFNLYTYRYSLVANHYQYLASAGIIALASAGAVYLLRPILRGHRLAGAALAAVLLATLAGLTWRESHQYSSAEELYRTTISRNPTSWMAYTNLGALKVETSPNEAVAYLKEALRLKLDLAEARGNLGTALRNLGRTEESIAEYKQALSVKPTLPGAQAGLASALLSAGRAQEALARYQDAIRLAPGKPELHRGMGEALRQLGRRDEAIVQFTEAVRLRPDDAAARCSLGDVLREAGRLEDAAAQYREALPSAADKAAVYNSLGTTLDVMGRLDLAVAQFREAIRLDPEYSDARFNLANLLQRTRRSEEAAAQYLEVLRRRPDDAEAHNNLGVALMSLGREDSALEHFRDALRIAPDYPDARANLARASATLK